MINQVYDGDCMYYTSSSRYGNYTNNPCIYKTKFFKEILEKFLGDTDSLEGLISRWCLSKLQSCHSEGLFTHFDIVKYGTILGYYKLLYKRKRNIKIMDTQNNFSVHYQTWKNKDEVKKVLTEFRNHFPNNPIRLVSDNGADYNDFVDTFEIVYDFQSSNVFPG